MTDDEHDEPDRDAADADDGPGDGGVERQDEGPGPWAKTSSGDDE